ncbi:helix-turn-helix domain-containing protein [Saccharothrix longispora]|uniref:helix-turn-helix domain-containing protein n=1 Tax=Saccharothrix longispora TaxID=33920 RepID=UPI0028FD434F|nr:helix-turn-helix domain-containing protein [Saccharothrix longispora]MBY8850675.1 helix-turn-helix domain-containing protein [Saccharothrix sp. MB29]MDU0292361.1 helix-turn-helix domain-containing protein [Saccharothrix longispora]
MDGNLTHWQFGDLLKKYRMKQGATQRQLADLSTVSVRAIRDLEAGRASRPRRDTVRLIAEGLRLSGRELTTFEAAAMRSRGGVEIDFVPDLAAVPPPAALDVLVGRDAEVSSLLALLGEGGSRLVAVTGLPGVGKTRLVVEVAGRLHDSGAARVLWDAATAQAPGGAAGRLRLLVHSALAVAEDGEGWEALATLIGDREAVLVLDGHDPAWPDPDRALALAHRCRRLRLLRTTRGSHPIPGERVVALAPLAHGHAVRLLGRLAGHGATGTTGAAPTALTEVAARLDGLPGALEAAASWLVVYRPDELLDLVRADPLGVVADRLPDLRDALRRALSGVDGAAVGALAAARGDWSVADAARLTGIAPVACARLVRHLLLLGLVRPVGDDRFRVLALAGALTASVLPVGLPLDAARDS